MINIGVTGYGYWGPNLVRNFIELPNCRVIAVSDLHSERLALAQARYPGIKTTQNFNDLLTDVQIDAIAIATPVSTHFELAQKALQAGKHVLVEKPLTATVEQGEQLLEIAARYQRILMVDHTFVYTGAVRKIKDLVQSGQLGNLYYYDSVRINLGLFQHDVNVLWDLAVHDLAIMDYILPEQPCAVATTGMAHMAGQPEDVAYLTCFFSNNLIAHVHVNWLAPVKIRRTLVGGDQRMIVYNDLEPDEKIKVYDKGVEGVYQQLVNYRTGDVWIPKLDRTEALRAELLHFIQCIERQEQPLTDGAVGLRVVRNLQAATKSMKQRGQPVELTGGW